MNERKSNRQTQKEKDYYFPVVLSQLFCCAFIVGIFFFVRSTGGWQQLSEKYSSLLEEDFLSVELSGVVSGVKEYLLDGSSSLAVNGSRVEPFDSYDVTDDETISSQAEIEITAEEEPTVVPSETEKTTSVAVRAMSMNAMKQSVPLKLTYKKQQNMVLPVDSKYYTSYFGERTDPIEGDEDYHKGIDIAADEGEPIKAVFDAVVTSVGEDDRSGKYVFLEHEKGIVTFYCHCSEILAREGESVKQGDIIALVGSTGYSTGPHLHFEVRMNGESVDPLPLLENAD